MFAPWRGGHICASVLPGRDGIGKSVGTITIKEGKDGVTLEPKLKDLPPGEHGFHMHEKPSCDPADKDGKKSKAPKTYDFNALDLNGRMRSPQLLYFLERANEELERASLEKRSFIPHMVRSLEEEAL